MTNNAVRDWKNRGNLKAVSSLLEGTFKAFHLKKKVASYSAFPHWEEIVGKEIAKVCVPEKIVRGNILVLRVLDAVWAQELSLRQNEILSALHAFPKGALIEDIRFVTGNPKTVQK